VDSRVASRNGRERHVSWDLVAVLKLGSRIVNSSPDEQAMLETHGFWSGRME
jgi:hypothetical protein